MKRSFYLFICLLQTVVVCACHNTVADSIAPLNINIPAQANVKDSIAFSTTFTGTYQQDNQFIVQLITGTENEDGSVFGNTDTTYYFGDSYTLGIGASPVSYRFSSEATASLGGVEKNFGIGSSTMQAGMPLGTNSMQQTMNRQVPWKSDHSKMIVIEYGLNDVGCNAPGYDTVNFKRDYRKTLNAIRQSGWLARQVVLLAPAWVPDSAYRFYATFNHNGVPTRQRHLKYVDAVRAIAEEYGALYINAYDSIRLNGAGKFLAGDSLHPNNAGHKYIAGLITNTINGYNRRSGSDNGIIRNIDTIHAIANALRGYIHLPADLHCHTSYQLRIISTEPQQSTGLSAAFEILNAPEARIVNTADTVLYAGVPLVLKAAAASAYSYQWLRNGVSIAGDTAAQLVVKDAGSYQVKVSQYGCDLTAAVQVVKVHSPGGLPTIFLSQNTVKVAPNPARNFTCLRFEKPLLNSVLVQVIDGKGRLISSYNNQEQSLKINLAGLTSGLYYIKVKTATEQRVLTLMAL